MVESSVFCSDLLLIASELTLRVLLKWLSDKVSVISLRESLNLSSDWWWMRWWCRCRDLVVVSNSSGSSSRSTRRCCCSRGALVRFFRWRRLRLVRSAVTPVTLSLVPCERDDDEDEVDNDDRTLWSCLTDGLEDELSDSMSLLLFLLLRSSLLVLTELTVEGLELPDLVVFPWRRGLSARM